MPSSATARGRLEKQGSGENSNTWGHIKLNGVLDLLDEQIDGVETVALTVSPTTLTTTNYASDQQRNKAYRFTGTGSHSVTVPATEWVKLFLNAATGTLTVSNGTSSTAIAAGKGYWIASDGTNLYKESSAEEAAIAAQAQAANAAGSASIAAGHVTAALGHADSAAGHVASALGHADSASGHKDAAAASATLAQNWATSLDLVGGGLHSARKYAQDAAASAAASAASTGIPAITGHGLKSLRVKADESGTEWANPLSGAFLVTGTGSGAAQTLTIPAGFTATNIQLFFDGVRQRPITDYAVSGTTLSFTAPAAATIIAENNGGATGPPGTGGASTPAGIGFAGSARFLGRYSAGAGAGEELTGSQATLLLDTFTSALRGLAPASGGGTTNFLRADGNWAAPAGGGGGSAAYSTLATVAANNTSQFIQVAGLGAALQDVEIEYLNLKGASATYTSLQLSNDNGATWSPAINIGFVNGAAAYHSGKLILSNARGNVHTPTGYANGSASPMADKAAVMLGPSNYQFGTIRLDGGFNALRIGNPGTVNWESGTVKVSGR